MGEVGHVKEGISSIPVLVALCNQVTNRIDEKYTSRKPQNEARVDALLFAVVQHAANRFDPRQMYGEEQNPLEVTRWEKAIESSTENNWEPMREALKEEALHGWKASKLDEYYNTETEKGDALRSAEAFHLLAQSI